jgi:hypothetical protein
MAKSYFKYSRAGFNELRRSPEMLSACQEIASQVMGRAGKGYGTGTRMYRSRCAVAIFPVTQDGVRDNLKNNTLLKALG